jgi:predicted membrane protein
MAAITEDRTIELATANVERAADRIEQVYQWEVERMLAGLRAALAIAGSIFGVALAALFGEVGRGGPWPPLVIVGAFGVSLAAAVFLYAKLGRLFGNYLESLLLFSLVERRVETD